MSEKIAVLMSTFNGEKFIKEQIDSILNQKDVDFDLIIRDDGSSDNTCDIIREYKKKDTRVKFVESKPLGVGKSFMKLLAITKGYDYYSFADQDDVWHDDKLISAINMIKKQGVQERVLYCCNQNNVDENLNFISVRFPSNYKSPNKIAYIFNNFYAGCTMVINRKSHEVLVSNKRMPQLSFFEYRIHDAWISCVASYCGKIIYDDAPHMNFRRSGSNFSDEYVIGNKKNIISLYLGKFKRLKKSRLKKGGIAYTARELRKGYNDYLSEQQNTELCMIEKYNKNMFTKIKLLKSDILKDNGIASKNIFRLKIILGIL